MPIRYLPDQNLLDSDAEALVNPVNCVGVMGKGLAKGFEDRFRYSSNIYKMACKNGRLHPGTPYIIRNQDTSDPRWIVHAPTKDHWRGPSQYPWIEEIASGLRWFCMEHAVSSIAVPKMGCGEGGLHWTIVRAIIIRWLGDLDDVDVQVYGEPPSGIV